VLGRCPIRAQIHLDPLALSARRARRFVAETLQAWGEVTNAELVDVATLLVSELVTNAVVHAGSAALVVISPADGDDGCLRVEVYDEGDDPPTLRPFDNDATSGRGLALVAAMSDRWGVQTLTNADVAGSPAKGVWFELDTRPVPAIAEWTTGAATPTGPQPPQDNGGSSRVAS
jgi:anti-sigma regulatory factor (Ser/Thr protein kinase)